MKLSEASLQLLAARLWLGRSMTASEQVLRQRRWYWPHLDALSLLIRTGLSYPFQVFSELSELLTRAVQRLRDFKVDLQGSRLSDRGENYCYCLHADSECFEQINIFRRTCEECYSIALQFVPLPSPPTPAAVWGGALSKLLHPVVVLFRVKTTANHNDKSGKYEH